MNKHEIEQKLKRNCQVRGLEYSDEVYSDEIENAIEALNERRGFIPTEDKAYEDKYSNLIYKMALYAITKMGAEGELSHQENNISRTYQSASDYPQDLMNQITPLVRGV